MTVLGVHALTGQLRFGVLSGTRASPVLEDKGRLVTPSESDVPALMDWYDTQFRKLVLDHAPDKIAYRLTLEPKKKQLITSIFPFGLLNLIAFQQSLPVNEYTPRSFAASKLGLPKGTDLYDHCENTFGSHPPYWDKNQMNAILTAWFELEK